MTENPTPLVLVVESDPIQRDIVQIVLKRLCCDIIFSIEPEKILSLVSSKHPSLIILDTFVPGTSGIEILTELQINKVIKHTVVIMISSYGFPDIIDQAKKLGAHEFLIKPLDTDEFSRRIKSLLEI